MNNSPEMTQNDLKLPLEQWQDATLGGYDCVQGAGEIHLLHGNGFCARTLEPFAASLDSDARWLLTDIPGQGVSQRPGAAEPDWNQMAEDIASSIRQRASGPVTGIGHSMGGVLTLMAAARHSDVFSRIVLLDPVLFPPEIIAVQALLRRSGLWRRTALVRKVSARRSVWPGAAALAEDLRRKALYRDWHSQALEAFVRYGTVADEEGRVRLRCAPEWEAAIFGSYPRKLWRSVAGVSCPVDILVASRSYGFIPRAVRKAKALNSNVKVHEVSGTHCFPMENPEQAAQLVRRIIS